MHPSEFTKIVLLSMGAALLYAVVHNLLGAAFCPEYLAVGLPPAFQTTSAIGLALGWALLGTWWLSLVLGLALAVLARVGPEPHLNAREFLKPGGYVLAATAVTALIGGVAGYLVGWGGAAGIPAEFTWQVPSEHAAGYVANQWAEWAAYAGGIAATFLLYRWVWQRRNLQQHVVESLRERAKG